MSKPFRANLKQEIRHFILVEFLPGEDASNLRDDTPLLSSNILDSMATLKLVDFLERSYDVTIEVHEPAEFETVEDIAGVVERKL